MIYYDMHSHLLPEMDDGSKSVEQSLEIIEKLRAQNVKKLCFTPHFYTNEESLNSFLKRRYASVNKLLPHIPSDVEVCIGAEVYVTSYLFNNRDLSQICYGNSDFILCEFPFGSHFSDHTMDYFYRLKGNYGLSPVLTHIERYHHLMSDETLVQDLVDEDIIIQTNVGAFKGFSQKRKLLKYIKRGYIDIVGTDCHSLTRGNPEEFIPTINLIKEKCGREYVNRINEMSEEIFSPIRMIKKGQEQS